MGQRETAGADGTRQHGTDGAGQRGIAPPGDLALVIHDEDPWAPPAWARGRRKSRRLLTAPVGGQPVDDGQQFRPEIQRTRGAIRYRMGALAQQAVGEQRVGRHGAEQRHRDRQLADWVVLGSDWEAEFCRVA